MDKTAEQIAAEDEAYELGRLDGWSEAVQHIDCLTGGDGEYYASTIPGRGCETPAQMVEGIVERFAALSARPAGDYVLVREIETVTGDFCTEPGEPFYRIEINGFCADFDYREAADNFAAAINARIAARPAGDYVMVPVEPTEAMMEAANVADRGMLPWADQYRAMIAARPADSDMVERVGKALCLSSGDDPEREGPWDTWWEESPYAAQARAAIAAMGSADMGKGEG